MSDFNHEAYRSSTGRRHRQLASDLALPEGEWVLHLSSNGSEAARARVQTGPTRAHLRCTSGMTRGVGQYH
jgi:hypothetical protein